jgi:pimeloyl-ACP methyl ester carboxylesterase
MAMAKHSNEFSELFDHLLESSPAAGRHVELESGRRAHVIEAGAGDPLVMLHSGGTSSLLFLPLIERVTGLRVIAVDRPGFGLSDPIDFARDSFRSDVITWVSHVLDALDIEQTALLGNSMGGTWALWYALEHPERIRRLILAGAVPMAPGATMPTPLRIMFGLMITPVVGPLMSRMLEPSPESVVKMMSLFGEGETVLNYPEQIAAQVVAGRDPGVAQANVAEMRAVGTALGEVRRELRLLADELARLSVPTLIAWGEHDPIGGPAVARALADAIPGSRLELLPTAHMPWFAEPDRTADLVTSFVREADPSGGASGEVEERALSSSAMHASPSRLSSMGR